MGQPYELLPTSDPEQQKQAEQEEPGPPQERKRRSCGRRAVRVLLLLGLVWFVAARYGPQVRQHCGSLKAQFLGTELDDAEWPQVGVNGVIECTDIDGDDEEDEEEDVQGGGGYPPQRPKRPHKPHPHKPVTKTFGVPVDADALSVFSRGDHLSGVIDVHAADSAGLARADEVTVAVTIAPRFRNRAKACLLQKNETSRYAVGIFTRKRRWGGHGRGGPFAHHHVKIDVTFPPAADDFVLFKEFHTSLPVFRHHVHALEGKVHFTNITLHSVAGHIDIKSLGGTNVGLGTVDGPISGHIAVSKSLGAATVNAPINVKVKLHNAEETDGVVVAAFATVNSAIAAELSLSSDSGSGGKFVVAAVAVNAPVSLQFNDAPLGSTLNCTASTLNSKVEVKLHPTYEGSFKLKGTVSPPTLIAAPKPADPSGEDRTWHIKLDKDTRREIAGEVYWGEKGDDTPEGTVSVEAFNGPVVVHLGA